GRVLAGDVQSEVDVPGFDRSMMDGYALRAADTSGASGYNVLRLNVIGESLPGAAFDGRVDSQHAVRIMTGAPLPAGADAVLPAERVEVDGTQILAAGEVSPGKHVGRRGEDVAKGDVVLTAGRVLRPQDIGVLSSIGWGEVPVIRRPLVRIVVTGNELLPPGTKPRDHKIADANSPMLAALIERDGGVAINPGIVSDEREAILSALRDEADVVLVSGGSSVGQEDFAPTLLAEHGELAIHGIAMRPSSPTGMGTLDGRLVLLLPGNPVSCLCAYDFFAGRAIRALGGRSKDWPHRQITVPLTGKIVSVIGRLDYARVKLTDEGAVPLAISGASILSSTTRADGFVLVPPDSEGYPAGAEVQVFLYDQM
ncbi:MAG: molybdopterin molybdotransferase MoeA, partial [Planctomycetes bacterium]|nr:molybdopterin molybdotransferase MoeA [Planctomycetota bacterium]